MTPVLEGCLGIWPKILEKGKKLLRWFWWVLSPEPLEPKAPPEGGDPGRFFRWLFSSESLDSKKIPAVEDETQRVFFRWLLEGEVLKDTETAYSRPPGK